MAPTPACALVPTPPVLPPSARPRALVPADSGRRRRLAVAAASPLVEEAVRATEAEPITKEDLVAYLASGCKPRSDWRIGTEHGKFGFQVETLRPINYQQIRDLLNGGAQNISMEPGGQIELSGAPLETLHQTRAEVNSHLCQVKAVGEELGIGFLGLGFQPKWALSDMPIMPKAKFEIARNYMPKVGSSGLDMMFRTCTVQVNLDYGSEQDMIMKLRASIALQPIATAIFANSPFKEGKLSGFLSLRSYTYTDTDSDRTGMLPFVFDSSFGFERYVDYVLDVPMYFIHRNKRHINCTGMSFRDFMAGKLPQVPGERPTLNDWEIHLGSIYPEVRLKRFLEMTGADGGPFSALCALPAFWVGLLYDDESLRCITAMIADWISEERDMLRRKVPVTGLKTQFRGGYVRDLAENLVKLAKDGLQRRGHMEAGFLNEVDEVVSTGVTQAEKLAKLYKTKWQYNVDPVFREFIY
ncbi:glutamate--cysteine ligase B, chloroplastic-like [Panicum virgatum]|uniref:glutamate--cysteine ligase B, chloroplastic-like n=1 Tax=Panicum virgatum TaxID=38727 RepID=UPI0019D65AA8|nr:glutamate--cysteine ligase B, chloroplastic-like [Panicum virgatum]